MREPKKIELRTLLCFVDESIIFLYGKSIVRTPFNFLVDSSHYNPIAPRSNSCVLFFYQFVHNMHLKG